MKKFLLPLIILLALLLASCQPAAPAAPAVVETEAVAPAASEAPVAPLAGPVLTIINLDGEARDFTLEELKQLPATEGQAGIKSSTGKITPPSLFKGVLLSEILQQAGGVDSTMGVEIEAKDGYAMTMSADQIASGDFIAYDSGTGDETQSAGALQALIAYEIDGKPLNPEQDGELRLVVISEKNNQVTDGHWSIKWVRKVTIKQLAQEWDLTYDGGIDGLLDRGSFESCSTGKCHASEWTDDKAQTWSGTPLYLIAGYIDDETKHGDGSFNQELADAGYTVEVVSKDGFSATFDILRLIDNENIIVANSVNGNPLNEEDFPLRLVGADVGKKEGVGAIDKIILHFGEKVEAEPTEAPAAAASASPVELPEGKAFMINGLVSAGQAWSMDELRALEVVKLTVEHPKKGAQEAEGVRLSLLLEAAGVDAGAKQVTFTAADGYTITADLQAVLDCADCLVTFDDTILRLSAPGMESGFWVKDLIAVTLQ